MTTIVDTPEGIEAFRLLSIHGRLKLELKGLSFRPIPGVGSTFTLVKKEFGFKGSKPYVFEQYENMLREKGIIR